MNHVLLGKHGSVKSLRECDRNWNMSNVVGVKKFIIIIFFFTQDGEDTSINNAMAGLLNISRYKILFFLIISSLSGWIFLFFTFEEKCLGENEKHCGCGLWGVKIATINCFIWSHQFMHIFEKLQVSSEHSNAMGDISDTCWYQIIYLISDTVW